MKKVKKVLWVILPYLIPILLLVLWEIGCRTGRIYEHLVPRPTKIAVELWRIIQKGVVWKNLKISLRRVLIGYAIGASAGLIIGILNGLLPWVKKATGFLLDLIRPMPIIVWIPVIILVLGIGEISKEVIVALATFWPVLLNVTDGIINVDKKYLEVARLFNKSKLHITTRVVLPAALPSIKTGLKLASSTAMTSVVAAEMFAASSGIGYFVTYSKEMSQTTRMYAGVVVIGVIGFFLNLLLGRIGNKSTKESR